MQTTLRKNLRPSERKVLSFAEEKHFREREKLLEGDLRKKEIQQGVSPEPANPKLVEQKLKETRAMLNQFGADRLEGNERTQAELEVKKIEDALRKKWGGEFPTLREYWMQPKEGIAYLNLVDKLVNLNKDLEYQELVRRWRSLRRRMEPADRHIDSTLHLFKR